MHRGIISAEFSIAEVNVLCVEGGDNREETVILDGFFLFPLLQQILRARHSGVVRVPFSR